MDTVRFGRVLGSGARSAARTLIQAIDAAKADNPPPRPAVPNTAPPTANRPATASSPRRTATQGTSRVAAQGRGLRQGAGRFRELALKPFVRLSGVLVLEIVGVFFGVFAVYGLNTMW